MLLCLMLSLLTVGPLVHPNQTTRDLTSPFIKYLCYSLDLIVSLSCYKYIKNVVKICNYQDSDRE